MRTYRIKQTVEAEQWTGENFSDLERWAPVFQIEGELNLWMAAELQVRERVNIGDWIIKRSYGTFTTCTAEEFEREYEPVQ